MKQLLTVLAMVAATQALVPSASAASATADDIYARQETLREITTQRDAEGVYHVRAPLAAFRAEQGGLFLSGVEGEAVLYAPLAGAANVQSARLVLRHASSRAIADYAPHLRVEVNGQFAAQLDASTNHVAAMDEITLDPNSLKPGFNAISLTAVQRYTLECMDPEAADLWTEIDTERSYLEISYARRPFAAGLADLKAVITPAIGGVEDLTVAVGGDTPEAKHLRWGALGVQAITNRLNYKIPKIQRTAIQSSDSTSFAGPAPRLALTATDKDVLVIGTLDELAGITALLPGDVEKDEAILAIGPSPVDPSRFLILATGHTETAVERALAALAQETFPFADAREMRILEIDAPYSLSAAELAPLTGAAAYSFAELGLKSQSVLGKNSARFDLPVNLPADWHVADDATVDFSLDFAYGAGLKQESVLNIFVNDMFHRAISLTNPNGEAASRYKLSLPARVFSAGRNTVSLQAELDAPQQGQCATRNPRHLAFTLEGSSLIRLPEASRFVELPNLSLLSSTGYPYSGTEAASFAIHAASKSDRNMAAAWTLAARLGQAHKARFTHIDFAFDAKPAETHTLLVGARHELSSLTGAVTTMTPDAPSTAPSVLRQINLSSLGGAGLVLSDRNPAATDTLLTVVTAETDASLESAVATLVKPSHWSQLAGAAAIWRTPAASLAVQPAHKTFMIGNLTAGERAAHLNARSPLRWIVIMASLLFGLAALLAGLARYMRSRMKS